MICKMNRNMLTIMINITKLKSEFERQIFSDWILKIQLNVIHKEMLKNTSTRGEQDGRGVGGREGRLSPRIHQKYTFRHRSACRTPAESGQECLTSGKECTEPCKTQ